MEFLDVALLDLLHQGFALEEVAAQVGGKLARDDIELVVGDFGKGDRAAHGNQVGAPLKNKAGVPENEQKENGSKEGERTGGGAEETTKALEQELQAKNEDGSERNEKAVPKSSHAVPVGIAGNQVKECGGAGGEEVREGLRGARREEKAEEGE